MTDPLHGLAASNIVAGYPQANPVLRGVDFHITPGERVALLGRSGSGKSTLLKVLLAQIRPQSGSVTHNGQQIRPGRVKTLREYRRQVQYIPQDPVGSLDPHLPVHRLIGDPLRHLQVAGDHEEIIRRALRSVHLGEEFLPRTRHEISGGQAQRVAIARALATGAKIILADEPVSGLDLPLRNEVLRTFSQLQGIGIVFATHDLDAAAMLCERGLVLYQGRVVERGPMRDILLAPEHEETATLVEAIPRL